VTCNFIFIIWVDAAFTASRMNHARHLLMIICMSVSKCNVVHILKKQVITYNNALVISPRRFGLTMNGCALKALLAIGHRFKSPVGA